MSGEVLLQHSYWIALAPLLAFVVILVLRNFVGLQGAWVGTVAMFYCFVHSLLIALGIFFERIHLPNTGLQGHFFESTYTWFSAGNFDFRVGLLIDGLSAMMLVVVTLVSFLVQLYSISYMHEHRRYGRYFAYVNLFTFSMLVLVLANDMLQFFIGWELVGLCSYLLIGFDFERDAAGYAGRKAFLTTKVGDLGMYLGLLIIFNYLGTFNIPLLHQNYQNMASLNYPGWVLLMVPLLLFFGAMGKSAQFPLHVWLPDAMEGPTPASALIHAATMVAAGVYMVARVFFLFEASPLAMDVVAWVGVATAVVAASMGLVSEDIKRVLAFSTVSQLGFMMVALGCGGYAAGMFHLTTHAAFKALLFLCAGSVIHAVHTNDMWKMGGLKTQMPITCAAYLVGTLAIAGFPFMSGFFSKEEVLAAAYNHNPLIFGLLSFAALLTSFYMFRSLFLTFFGLPRDKHLFQHAHESPLLMTIPLMVLALLSIFLGGTLYHDGNLARLISWGSHGAEQHHASHVVLYSSLSAFGLGFVGAFWVYLSKPPRYEFLQQKFALPHKLLSRRYLIDELYLWFIGNIYTPVTTWFAKTDYDVVDQFIVDGFGRMGKRFSWVSDLFDGKFVDRVLVDGQSDLANWAGDKIRKVQSGLAQSYLFWMILGLGGMIVWISHNFK
ncbi:MAG: NAD(P)H-quinone oxidoreductase subunit 2, chloroplastic [Elusimicrobia bacterium]|nr:NAD(P)H-quinone oxidoreductase subunit 2, chloroplastic [Elusimicrobiota bacterium]